ncbi:hypothetical protein OIU84_017851 [Salix udensis]|uniref:Uncharacterized protein n=1 Tax=Salix udensis TaxID=889485 RepID=A0AAD6PM89_9ROSI|nr:hypothetical protein OIU84_017851 [Salix udensis]
MAQNGSVHDIEKELQEFDESKAGVKGLADAGIINTPPFFVTCQSSDLIANPAVESACCFSESRCNREIAIKHSAYIKRVGGNLLELLAEALGLERNHLTIQNARSPTELREAAPAMIPTSRLSFAGPCWRPPSISPRSSG